jgi:hypothetical protein
MTDEYYTIKYLVNKLHDVGIIKALTYDSARQTVQGWIRRGRLVMRKQPHTGYYAITKKEIDEIVKEFLPGGSGKWHYKSR